MGLQNKEFEDKPLTDEWRYGDAKARDTIKDTIVLLVDDSQHSLIRNCKTAKMSVRDACSAKMKKVSSKLLCQKCCPGFGVQPDTSQ